MFKNKMDELLSHFDPQLLEEMAHLTRVFRLVTSIYQTNSIDRNILVTHVYKHYRGNMPLQIVEDVVDDILPEVLTNFVINGQLTAEGIIIAQQHIVGIDDPVVGHTIH